MMTQRARIVAMAVLVVSGAALVALIASGGHRADAGERVVLVLAGPNVSNAALPLAEGASKKFTVVRVSSVAELKASSADNTAAIVVDKGSRAAADWAWLQGQFRSGRAVVSVGSNMESLLNDLLPASKDLIGEGGLGWTPGDTTAGAEAGKFSVLVATPGDDGCAFGATDTFGGDRPTLVGYLETALNCVTPTLRLEGE